MFKPISPSDAGSDVDSTISFNRPGTWDGADATMGSALTLPAYYADLKVGGNLFIEFLHIGTGKNHVVFRVPLEEPVPVGETEYHAMRIAMDLANEAFVVLDNSENGAFYDAEKQAGIDYYPGQLIVRREARKKEL